jgi:TetR/AcrR family transcriptional regulator
MPGNRRIRTRPERSREGARAAILSAAERVFAQAGLAGARTEIIAAEARVNKALLFYYFKSKEKLYHAVLEEHLKAFNQKALALLATPGSARRILLEYVTLQFDFISARHRHASLFQQFLGAGRKSSDSLVRKYIVPRSEAVERLLKRGMRDGEFRRLDPFHTAVSIAALVVFYFSAAPVLRVLGHADAYSKQSLSRRKKEVLDFMQRALFRDPDARSV